jgi:DMSO/TMAO reductase YedYZ molybdopterin-dependent catalytic subunit
MGKRTKGRFPAVGDGSGIAEGASFHKEEIQLALRNRGIPLEGLRYPITPTGMHYLLVHFDIPDVDAAKWRLAVGGLVSKPMSLTLNEIKKRPVRKIAATMECAGNGRALMSPRPISQPWMVEAVSTARWTGTPLRGVLKEAGLSSEATEILFTGRDRGVQGDELQYYQRSLSASEASRGEVLLAYEMNGLPLQPQHGFPLRLLVPGWYGMSSVKWLDSIEAIDKSFDGYQMTGMYRYSQAADDRGEPVTLMRVRSLMIPPGVPDFLTRTRLVSAGRVRLAGRAWAGRSDVSRVEVSTDGGSTWSDANLGERPSRFAWREWWFSWQARRGSFELCVRATDTEGNTQPMRHQWNFLGMGDNEVQRVPVVVE